jgi:hypothetical protein
MIVICFFLDDEPDHTSGVTSTQDEPDSSMNDEADQSTFEVCCIFLH